jgi:hypothetical protein
MVTVTRANTVIVVLILLLNWNVSVGTGITDSNLFRRVNKHLRNTNMVDKKALVKKELVENQEFGDLILPTGVDEVLCELCTYLLPLAAGIILPDSAYSYADKLGSFYKEASKLLTVDHCKMAADLKKAAEATEMVAEAGKLVTAEFCKFPGATLLFGVASKVASTVNKFSDFEEKVCEVSTQAKRTCAQYQKLKEADSIIFSIQRSLEPPSDFEKLMLKYIKSEKEFENRFDIQEGAATVMWYLHYFLDNYAAIKEKFPF